MRTFIKSRSRMSRTALAVAASAAIVIGTIIGNPGVAAADAQGCTLAPRGMVCSQLYGSGTYLRSGNVMRAKTSSLVCNFSGGLYAYWPGGGGGFLAYASYSGCVWQGGQFNFSINRYLPYNTYVCGYFYESGVQQGGGACNWVR